MSARERILARLRNAPPGPPAPLPDLGAWYAADAAVGHASLVERFRANMAAARAEVHDTDAAGWPDLLLDLVEGKGLRTLLVGNGTAQAAALQARGRQSPQLVRYEEPAAQWRAGLFERTDAGFTTARSAVADTGSLVLWPDAREPRLLSLVPPVHFVLVDAAAIRPTLRAVMTAERWADGMPTNALVISGPSKTADIQQTLAYGAHGPRELVVLLRHATGSGA